MKIIYPYNEILPKKRAHDVFVFQECARLSHKMDVTLLCGKGSLEREPLEKHYAVSASRSLNIQYLPIVRKNNLLNISWNRPFFFFCQKEIRKQLPDWVILSVRKQGDYHLSRKIAGVRYLYEVHELSYYPSHKTDLRVFRKERTLLSRADLITVTTNSLKHILETPPYSLKTPIVVVPLAVEQPPLLSPKETNPFLTLMYVGQLYEGQGLIPLLDALSQVDRVLLKIVGGKKEEIDFLKKEATRRQLSEKIEFLGFLPPSALSKIASEADAFVAPFENTGRMAYVAHTKLLEYAHWGRPFIAPKLPVVEEHFPNGKGVLLFEPGNVSSLAACIDRLRERAYRNELQREIEKYTGKFSWEVRLEKYSKLLTKR